MLRKLELTMFFVVLATACLVGHTAGAGQENKAAEFFSSWGVVSQENGGTYHNPVLNADYPDSDVVQHGDKYYLISSTVHYAPGMIILESRDMVNWKIIGHVFDKLTCKPNYGPDQMNGYKHGVWAGDLAYHDGRWYCYFIDFRSGLYMTSAPDIRGPWKETHCMLEKEFWTDPAVYWDDDAHQAYLICNFGKGDAGVNEIRLFKMSWDGRDLLDDGRVIYEGNGAEAAKIYRIDGQWYVFLVHWMNGDRKQLVLRSKTDSIYGPYERKIVMERGNGVDRSACQGALMQADDGSWWFIHQLVQNGPGNWIGRQQALEPVTWNDGWPMIGEDSDGDGIGELVWSGRVPNPGHPVRAPQTDDDFESNELGHQWEWNHNPIDQKWSLTERPGWLRLEAPVPVGKGGFWKAPNTLSQRIMGWRKGIATAKLDFSGLEPHQVAGFCHHSGVYHLLGVRAEPDGSRHLFLNRNGKVTGGPELETDIVWMRTEMEAGEAFFEYSLDGENYRRFGPELPLRFGRWRGNRIGFFCWNEKKPAGHVDVDWFRYRFHGPAGGME